MNPSPVICPEYSDDRGPAEVAEIDPSRRSERRPGKRVSGETVPMPRAMVSDLLRSLEPVASGSRSRQNAEPDTVLFPSLPKAPARPPTLQLVAQTPTASPSGRLDDSAKVALAPCAPAVAPSPLQALREHEVARTRRLIPIMLGIIGLTFVALPFFDGDPDARLAFHITLLISFFATLWLRHLLRGTAEQRVVLLCFVWLLLMSAMCAADIFFGLLSPAPIVMVLAIYFVGVSHNRELATFAFVTLATFHGSVSLLVTFGVMVDHGLIHANEVIVTEQLFGLALVETIMLAAFLVARASRQETLASFTRLQQAMQAIAQRDAMVMEARHDLQRAMRVGGPGSLTDRVVGSFKLGVLIGRGGMGEVYKASRVGTGEVAAVKVLQSGLWHRPSARARFWREVRLAAALDVPNVVRVLEVGGEGYELPYLAMEFLCGRSLAHYLRTRQRLSARQTLRMVREVGCGIHAAGSAGIVHRDLKPQNLFLAKKPDQGSIWKILDFGVSTLISSRGTLTQGRVVGTPAYMAPEQARGQSVDHRADLYSLAAIAYRSLTGYPPFRSGDVPAMLHDVVYNMPLCPTELCDLPGDIDAALAIGMAKDPDERFATAGDFADALEAAIAGDLEVSLRVHAARLMAKTPWR